MFYVRIIMIPVFFFYKNDHTNEDFWALLCDVNKRFF